MIIILLALVLSFPSHVAVTTSPDKPAVIMETQDAEALYEKLGDGSDPVMFKALTAALGKHRVESQDLVCMGGSISLAAIERLDSAKHGNGNVVLYRGALFTLTDGQWREGFWIAITDPKVKPWPWTWHQLVNGRDYSLRSGKCEQSRSNTLPPWDLERERWQRQPLQNDFPTRPDN